MKKSILTFFALLLALWSFAQNTTISGEVKDATTGETLIGANVLIKQGVGTVTDFDGKFSIQVENGEYDVKISYIGYLTQTQRVKATGETIYLNVKLESKTLDEVQIVADVARERQTPVAFTNVTPERIQQELAGRDIPMILNSTPGVYATQQGGGDGDARVNIRGFSQRNVAVMLDGIPVNDMENGWVYWSNWFGLDAITRTMQVQRGLSASKLALPSVGGTINIITQGINQKRRYSVEQKLTSDGRSTTSLAINSGKLKKGWGFTLAGSYKRGEGWVDETFSEAWFYYLKAEKRLGNHIISASTYGAPQYHYQRSYSKPIAVFDYDYARELGVPEDFSYIDPTSIDTVNQIDKGRRFNAFWGTYTDSEGNTHKLHEKKNYYYKPMYSLRHFWSGDKLSISNIFYASLGQGGGTRLSYGGGGTYYADPTEGGFNENGQLNGQMLYDANIAENPFNPGEAAYYIRSSVNNHYWYGLLSTFNYQQNENLTFSGGIDLRSYLGEHYDEVYDLFGAEFVPEIKNPNIDTNRRYEGDIVNKHYDGMVRWGGVFAQAEYSKDKITAFVNLTTALTGYSTKNYYIKDCPQTDWRKEWGFTFKAGANYNISEHSNFFLNTGYLSKAPRFRNIYQYNDTTLLSNIRNEFVKALELGYSFSSPKFALNLNSYYTVWENKPIDYAIRIQLPDQQVAYGNIQGINARHVGIEADFIYKILPNLDLQGLFSIGDWRWASGDSVRFYDDATGSLVKTTYFNAEDVHVGDAAQTQFGASLNYEPIKGLYLRSRITFFDRYFADFSPETLNGNFVDADGNPTDTPPDSWQIPSYKLVDFHAGYRFKIKKFKLGLKFSMLNVFDEVYVSDARDNDSYTTTTTDHDAKSASVHFGLGRRFMVSLKVSF